jgi:hypothetical protein
LTPQTTGYKLRKKWRIQSERKKGAKAVKDNKEDINVSE